MMDNILNSRHFFFYIVNLLHDIIYNILLNTDIQ
jgi:hypothetical protein